MKTRITNQILSAIIILIFIQSCGKEEIKPALSIENGDMEEGSIYPDNWWRNPTIPGKFTLSWTDQVSFSPKKALKISYQSESGDASNFAFWAQTINTNLPLGKTVNLKVMIKGNLIGQGVSIAIRGDDTPYPSGSGEQFSSTQSFISITDNFEWTEYSVKLKNINASTQSLTIYLILLPNTKGDVYFDDVTLTEM